MNNSTGDSRSNEVTVLGYEIYFPPGKKPFPAQLAVISKTLQALTRKQNALLESPTGTGKTLALLTSTLSWQKKAKLAAKENSQTTSSPMCAAGVQNPPMKSTSTTSIPASVGAPNNSVPKIYFCSRTHSQLQQAISELKSCHESYRYEGFIMSLLAGRPHLCVNDTILEKSRVNGFINKEKLNEHCLESLPKFPNDRGNRNRTVCPFSYNTTGTSFIEAKVWDIEDAHRMGRTERCCPYYTSSSIAKTADLIFAPYIYLIDPILRESSEISLEGSVVIIDEAHNIEDACRSAASLEVSFFQLRESLNFLELLEKYGDHCKEAVTGLKEFLQKLSTWIENSRSTLESSGYEVEERVWSGLEALVIFESELDLTEDTLNIYQRYYQTIVQFMELRERNSLNIADSSSSSVGVHEMGLITRLLSVCRSVLDRLFVVLRFMMSKISSNIEAYRVVIQRNRNQQSSKFELYLNIWCLSAHVTFKYLSDHCHSILLTSGTLSPLEPFEKELGVTFPIRVEAQHVIDATSQVYVRAVSTFDNTLMTSSYLNQSNLTYLDTLGRCILTLTRVSRGGVLAFFPSYSFLDKVRERWNSTQFIREFNNPEAYSATYHGTKVFYEPKESEKLDLILGEYYETIDQGKQGLFFAVCRGKVSEGIDFSDNYARTVIVIGIPFPSLSSLQVKLKRSYLDEISIKYPEMKYLTGNQWYDQQAFRAVNQAFGRCIRHIKDFGAIILCDSRYQKSHNQQQLSRWVRSNIVNLNRLEDLLLPLRLFFGENYERFVDHLKQIDEKRGIKKLAEESPLLVNSGKKRKKSKQIKKSSTTSSSSSTLRDNDDHNDNPTRCNQQTLSQLFSRYVKSSSKSTNSEEDKSISHVSKVRRQLVNCMLQWDWGLPTSSSASASSSASSSSISTSTYASSSSSSSSSPVVLVDSEFDHEGELVELSQIGSSILLQELPSQLQYLIRNFSSQIESIDEPGDDRHCKALRISNWSWPVSSPPLPLSCECTNQTKEIATTNSLFCLCQIHVSEEWNPNDRVVYRLLTCPTHPLDPTKQDPILLAAKIIAVGDSSSRLFNNSFVNWQLIQEIFSEYNPSLSNCVPPVEVFDILDNVDGEDETTREENFVERNVTHLKKEIITKETRTNILKPMMNQSSYLDVGYRNVRDEDDDDDFQEEDNCYRKKQDRNQSSSSSSSSSSFSSNNSKRR